MNLGSEVFRIAACCLLCPTFVLGQVAALLRADESSQLIQNQYADRIDLSRMRNVAMIQRFHRHGYLVPVPAETSYYYLHGIPAKYRYLRPWSKLFLDRLSRQYYARFHKRLRVTSLVRTVALQQQLSRNNENAAAARGALSSSHLTGATIDISKRWMSGRELSWTRRVVYSLRQKGYLYGIEEYSQPAFHVMVYRNYPNYVKGLTRRRARPRTSLVAGKR